MRWWFYVSLHSDRFSVSKAVLPAVVRRLDDAGVVVTELALRSSSLNEVFLSLTGHPADEDGHQSEGSLA